MTDWRKIKKIDGHVHILPDSVHAANPDSMGTWAYAKLSEYIRIMDEYNIESAVIMPFNDPWLMSMEFTAEAVHKNLCEMKSRYPGRFYAFADIDVRNSPEKSVEELGRATENGGLDGIKIHPDNSGVDIASEYNRVIFDYAQKNNIPVAIHSYPNSDDGLCAAGKIAEVAEKYHGLTVIVSHMGAFQWERLLKAGVYVDISAVLPDYVRTCGIKKTNEILRSFGAERLIFGTDYPDSRILGPQQIYDEYFDILNKMDFTAAEAEIIAYGNINKILKRRAKCV